MPCWKMTTGQPFAGRAAPATEFAFGTVTRSGIASEAFVAPGTGLKRVRLRLAGSMPGAGEGPAACQKRVRGSVE